MVAYRTSCRDIKISEISHFPSLFSLCFSIHPTLDHLFSMLADFFQVSLGYPGDSSEHAAVSFKRPVSSLVGGS